MEGLKAAVPYLATLRWYRLWLQGRLRGLPEEEARLSALREGGYAARGMARASLDGLLVSVPLAGGASALRRLAPEAVGTLMVSPHGDWPRAHLGAIEARYGRTPFYPHCRPALEEMLRNAPENHFEAMSEGLHSMICRLLGLSGDMVRMGEELRETGEALRRMPPGRLRQIGEEAALSAGNPSPEDSFLPVVLRKGPEALFILLLCNDSVDCF